MQDDQLLADLRALKYPNYLERAVKLEQSGVHTYTKLLALIGDANTDPMLRADAIWDLFALHKKVDGRRSIPVLMNILLTEEGDLRRSAMRALGIMQSKRAVEKLVEIILNREESAQDRMDALNAASMYKDTRIEDAFEQMMHNEAEDVHLRALAIEWFPRYEDMFDTWLQFLTHESADLRFWAAFRLVGFDSKELSRARAALDKLAANDDALPNFFGWQVGREALLPLENFYFAPFEQDRPEDSTWTSWQSHALWLVSPAPEYFTLQQKYRRWNADWVYENLPIPAFDLRVDVNWLRNEIGKAWTGVEFDVRQPKPQTYVLDWHLKIDGQNLLCGLHRDQYGVVLNGTDKAVYTFTAWYRSIIAPEHTLYLYEWADEGIELTPGITAEQIDQIIEARDEAQRAPAL